MYSNSYAGREVTLSQAPCTTLSLFSAVIAVLLLNMTTQLPHETVSYVQILTNKATCSHLDSQS